MPLVSVEFMIYFGICTGFANLTHLNLAKIAWAAYLFSPTPAVNLWLVGYMEMFWCFGWRNHLRTVHLLLYLELYGIIFTLELPIFVELLLTWVLFCFSFTRPVCASGKIAFN